jgi:hypothetical protein
LKLPAPFPILFPCSSNTHLFHLHIHNLYYIIFGIFPCSLQNYLRFIGQQKGMKNFIKRANKKYYNYTKEFIDISDIHKISKNNKEMETELTKLLKQKILGSGPISVSSFMKEALSNTKYGYYTKERSLKKVIGKEGDFITSPEISQIFNEILGIWCVGEFQRLNFQNFRIVEMGPGNGTLMQDLLKTTTQKFNRFTSSLNSVHMIETSDSFRKIQSEKLQKKTEKDKSFTFSNIPIFWNKELQEVPDDLPIIYICHEFFDALPVHQFKYTERGWSEILVDIDEENNENPYHFKISLAPGTIIHLHKASLLLGKYSSRLSRNIWMLSNQR